MSTLPTFNSDDYSDGRTKQSFKDETDINQILARAWRGGAISHLAKYGATYGDFSDIDDLLTAHQRLEKGQQIFNELPAELRREFGTPAKFYNYVNDPANADKLERVLPQLAKPGRQMPAVRRTAATEAVAGNAGVPPAPAPETAPQSVPDAPAGS